MEGSYLGNVRVWQEDPHPLVPGLSAPTSEPLLSGPHNPTEFADRLYAWESLKPSNGRAAGSDEPEPYTLQWFLHIEN